ncbi:MAG: hypothetical protein HDQ88_03255 [Clostridia bacterium]|nr:hypothetical protein [Clostridia bacterium]
MKETYVLSHYRSNQTKIAVMAYESHYDAQKALEAKLHEIMDHYGQTHKLRITRDHKRNDYATVLISGSTIILQHHLSITKLKETRKYGSQAQP